MTVRVSNLLRLMLSVCIAGSMAVQTAVVPNRPDPNGQRLELAAPLAVSLQSSQGTSRWENLQHRKVENVAAALVAPALGVPGRAWAHLQPESNPLPDAIHRADRSGRSPPASLV